MGTARTHHRCQYPAAGGQVSVRTVRAAAATDMLSAGVVLFTALTGWPPLETSTPEGGFRLDIISPARQGSEEEQRHRKCWDTLRQSRGARVSSPCELV
jgi:hypothetical protein